MSRLRRSKKSQRITLHARTSIPKRAVPPWASIFSRRPYCFRRCAKMLSGMSPPMTLERTCLPGLIGRRRIMAYDFVDENKKEIRYWRDVGTIDAYYEANMDLVSVSPQFNLYETSWPIRTMS